MNKISKQNNNDLEYLKEFSSYYTMYLMSKNTSAIGKLDEIYTNLDPNSGYSTDGWSSFKEYVSNMANSAAWAVVFKSENSSFIKKAINFSQYSLFVTKNNPYYLDTLAQLYYKDGQKKSNKNSESSITIFRQNT